MKRSFAALAAALMLGLFAPVSLAQTPLHVHISQGTLGEATAAQLMQLLSRALPDAEIILTDGTRTLEDRVMADEAPQLAICPAREAAQWAGEGLLLSLEGCVPQDTRIAQAVLADCTGEDGLYMAPLLARHARVAVNRRMLEEAQLGYLLDFVEYPVWLPIQLYQVLEEALLEGRVAMDVWPTTQGSDAALTLAQAMYGGAFLSPDGKAFQTDSGAALAGVEWLEEMADCGMIGVAQSRQEALDRFLAGETTLFIDWTDEDAKALAAQEGSAIEVAAMPYPSSLGIPVHAFEVIGVLAFASGDEKKDALAKEAAAFLMEDEQAARMLGERGIDEDGAVWLANLDLCGSPGLHGMLREMVDRVLLGEISAGAAMDAVTAVFGGKGNSGEN